MHLKKVEEENIGSASAESQLTFDLSRLDFSWKCVVEHQENKGPNTLLDPSDRALL